MFIFGFGFLKTGLRKIRDGLKFIARRKEMWLVADFIAPPVIRQVLPYIRRIDEDRGKTGKEKMLRAIKYLRKDPALKKMKESDLRWIIETALKIAEGKLQLVD